MNLKKLNYLEITREFDNQTRLKYLIQIFYTHSNYIVNFLEPEGLFAKFEETYRKIVILVPQSQIIIHSSKVGKD